MRRHRHAKIIATVGPASSSPEMLHALFLAGVDTFRLNFSHGTQADHAKVHAAIRALEQEIGRPIGILQDLQGPKIRVGTVAGGRLDVVPGEIIRFVLEGSDGDKSAIPLHHPEIFAAVAPGQDLLIDDGRVRVKVVGLTSDSIEAEVVIGGVISNRKGVNLPGTLLDLSPLTAKDRADLAFGLELGVDWVALSFVQKPADLIEARALIGDRAGIMTKVEKPQALERIDDIIRLSDAVMVARGDLGVEIPHEDVPGPPEGADPRLPPRGEAGRRRDPDARTRWWPPRPRPGPRPPTWPPRSMTAPTRSCSRPSPPPAASPSRRCR